ncbi:hypothetical protein CR513_62585, partial [Mucuna pruriens]
MIIFHKLMLLKVRILSLSNQGTLQCNRVDYYQYLRYHASQHSSSSSFITYVAHSSNFSVLSHLTYFNSLHAITLANGSKRAPNIVSKAKYLPFVPLDFVLYILNCLFNLVSISCLTHTLNCIVTLSHNSIVIQDCNIVQVIGPRHESQDLYHLSFPFVDCTTTSSPELLHNRLGHPILSKLQKMAPSILCLVLIMSHFYTNIQVLRSDNALVYFFITLLNSFILMKLYISLHVLIHPKQNGVAERKNRHLIKTTLHFVAPS